MPINTSNVATKADIKPSLEELLKQSPEQRKKMTTNYLYAKKDKEEQKSNLKKQLSSGKITKAEYNKQLKNIDNNLNQIYSKTPVAEIEKGKNGEIIAHKNKLAFIFIGDTRKSDENKLFNLNSPKITLAVGGGLEASFDPNKNTPAVIDPRTEFMPQASAQIHLISNADINVEGFLSPTAFTNKSAVIARSDVLDFSANQTVIIRSLGTPYVAGVRSNTPGGVYVISGQQSIFKDIKEPEPMVLGEKLNSALNDMSELIGQLISIIMDINFEIIALKSVLAEHTHLATGPAAPVSPSPEMIAFASVTAGTRDAPIAGNLYSTLVNNEFLKLNRLTAMSSNTFLSEYNKVN